MDNENNKPISNDADGENNKPVPNDVDSGKNKPVPNDADSDKKNSVEDEEFDIILKSIKTQKQMKKLDEEQKEKQDKENGNSADDNSKTKVKGTPIVKSAVPVRENGEKSFDNNAPTRKSNEKKAEGYADAPKNIVYFDDIEDKNQNGSSDKKAKKKVSFLGSVYAGIIKLLIYIAFICICVYILSTTIINIANDLFAFVKPDEEITVTIPENATLKDVAKILKKNNVIENEFVFEKYTDLRIKKSNSLSGEFISGDVVLNSNMNYDMIRKELAVVSERRTVRITIPEGLTVDETIDLLIENGVGSRDKYIEAIQNYEFDNNIVKTIEADGLSEYRKNSEYSYRLEGYLFPDTYDFFTDENEVAVIDKFLVNFEKKFRTEFYSAANEQGFTVDEIITLASLIEKEAGIQSDFNLVSSVFRNRLNHSDEFPRLECDATIQYALKERKSVLTGKDTDYDHPYNTYMYKGLPPGPICNPGYEAIVSALYPAESNYYYFVSGENKETVFSETLDQHNKAISEVLG